MMPLPEGSQLIKLYDVERAHIIKVYDGYKRNVILAAKALGIARATLYRKLKEYGIK